jgi:chemotaxis protein MotB
VARLSEHNKKKTFFPNNPEDEGEDDSWQVSYLDIITIVLGFLIILLSVSQIRKSSLPSLSTLFGKKSDESEFVTTPIDEIKTELDSLLRDQIDLGNIEIERDLNDLLVRFRGDDLYLSGGTQLEPKGQLIVEEVLNAFQQIDRNDFNIDVEGHTDNVPIRSSSFPSNWELSTARASNVVKYFRENGISEKRLKASGYADSRPIIQFDSLGYPFAASKDMNRRVVLRLYYTAENVLAANQDSAVTTAPAEEVTPSQSIAELAASLRDQARNNPVSGTRQSPVEEDPQIDETEENNTTTSQTEGRTPSSAQTQPQPQIQSEQTLNRTKPAPARVPSFMDSGVNCQFAIEADASGNLSRGFQIAANASQSTGVDFELSAVGEDFSVRTASFGSLPEALQQLRSVRNELGGNISLVHQCVAGNREIPSRLNYQIQFGAFQDEQNALDYSLRLLDEFNIQSYMQRSANTYNVVTGPYSSRDEVSEKITEFRSLGAGQNIFIKFIPDQNMAYGYLTQIQIATASVRSDLEAVQRQVQANTNIPSRIVEYNSSQFYLITDQYRSSSEAASALNSIRQNNRQLSPLLYHLEYY